MTKKSAQNELIERVLAYGRTDEGYLRWHANRFIQTKALYERNNGRQTGAMVLDIGAHWLHLGMCFALDGYRVTAVDVGGIFAVDTVQTMAKEHGIELCHIGDLSQATVFDDLPASSMDIVLFAETIEHITFNPLQMWQAIERIMKPGGRVIVTTPNYYFWDSRAWDLKRFLGRMGGGIPVDEIFKLVTYGHHWKEFSARELIRYFSLLPSRFRVEHIEYVSMNDVHRTHLQGLKPRVFRWLEPRVGFIRDTIYVEVVCEKPYAETVTVTEMGTETKTETEAESN